MEKYGCDAIPSVWLADDIRDLLCSFRNHVFYELLKPLLAAAQIQRLAQGLAGRFLEQLPCCRAVVCNRTEQPIALRHPAAEPTSSLFLGRVCSPDWPLSSPVARYESLGERRANLLGWPIRD